MGQSITSHQAESFSTSTPARILVPVDGTDESGWGPSYVLNRARTGMAIEAILLYVAPPIRQWEVLKFRTESEIRQFFHERADIFLKRAAAPLLEAEVPVRSLFREIEPVQGILAVAEELGCSEIVLPKPGCWGIFSSRLPFQVKRHSRGIPVTLVSAGGLPQG